MARARPTHTWLSDCCFHVTNTCYSPAQVFRFANMRTEALKRLRTVAGRAPIRFLNYILHPDGCRFLIDAEHPGLITEALRSFHVGTAHDYSSRRDWEGPLWRQRGTTITLVQKGLQALRCSLDMDFEMVRTGRADLFHPLLWKHTGHQELSGVRKRYRIIDRGALRSCFMDVPWIEFREWYITAATQLWNSGEFAAQPWWKSALVVGSRELCETVADAKPRAWLDLKVYPALTTVPDLADTMSWTVSMSRTRTYEYIRSLVPDKGQKPQA